MDAERLPLTKAAQVLGMSEWTLRRHVYAGKVPCVKTVTGRRFIPMSWIRQQIGETPKSADIRCALYARESSSENKSAIASQLSGLEAYAKAKGYQIVASVTEFASGVNDDRKKLTALLKRKDFDVLVVEHKERLTRFGFRWFETLSPFRIEVINLAANGRDDLMEDLVAVLTSFSARLYGQRRGRKKTQAVIAALKTP